MPVPEAGPLRATRRGRFAYAKKSVPMPIRETFKMLDHIPEKYETTTEDEDEESVQITQHQCKTPPHVFLSDDESLSFTSFLAVSIKDDLGDGSVHDYPQGQDPRKEVMKDDSAPMASRKKKEKKHEQRRVKEEAATETPDEFVPIELDMDDVPRRVKNREPSTRRRSDQPENKVLTDRYL
jgi:hypothetical protein